MAAPPDIWAEPSDAKTGVIRRANAAAGLPATPSAFQRFRDDKTSTKQTAAARTARAIPNAKPGGRYDVTIWCFPASTHKPRKSTAR